MKKFGNLLIYGDNKDGLKYLINEKDLAGKIDLVYIDPPFSTGIDFVVTEDRVSTISSSKNGLLAYSDKIKGSQFIDFLRERIKLIRQLMSEQSSIYLHIDYNIGHYVKIMMDEIFGIENYRNDIARIKCNPKNFNRIGYGNMKDLILFYTKNSNPIWNEPRKKYSENDIDILFPKINPDGRRYTTVPIHAPGETENGKSNMPFKGKLPPIGRHWRTDVKTLEKWDDEGLIEWSSNGNPRKIIFADEKEGKRVQDIWEFKDPQYPIYPTEKNYSMLDLIIKTSSNENSLVLDCFCGSGTTLLAAQNNNRNWIGIDKSDVAIKTIFNRFDKISYSLFTDDPNFEFIDLQEKKNINKFQNNQVQDLF